MPVLPVFYIITSAVLYNDCFLIIFKQYIISVHKKLFLEYFRNLFLITDIYSSYGFGTVADIPIAYVAIISRPEKVMHRYVYGMFQ